MTEDPSSHGPFPQDSVSPLGAQGGPAPSGPGMGRRLLSLFSAPREAFRLPYRTTTWLIPVIIMACLQTTQVVLLSDIRLATNRARLEASDRIPEEQKTRMLEGMEAGQASSTRTIFSAVGGAVGGFVTLLVAALIYFLALNFGMGATTRFTQVLTVVALASLVVVLREVLRLPIMLSKESLEVYTSPAALVGSDNLLAVQMLNRFDIFDLYRMFLLTVGFSVLTAKPAGRTCIPVIAVWVLGTLMVAAVVKMAGPWGQIFF
jgi:hypothetical protein